VAKARKHKESEPEQKTLKEPNMERESKGRHNKFQGKGVLKTEAGRRIQATPPGDRLNFNLSPGGGQSTKTQGKRTTTKNLKRIKHGKGK